MNLRAFLLVCLLIPLGALAQKKEKPRLLIYGSNSEAWVAAWQAVKSNVPTVLVYDREFDAQEVMVKFARRARESPKSDSLVKDQDSLNLMRDNGVGENEFNIGLSPFMTEIDDKTVKELKKSKKGWQVTLSDNQKFNVIAIIDASENSDLLKMSNLDVGQTDRQDFTLPSDMSLEMSRTTLASLNMDSLTRVVFLDDLLKSQKDNIFDLGIARKYILHRYLKQDGMGDDLSTVPYAKALGATAGYLAFFKTDASKIDIRKLQAELINFSDEIVPYQDVNLKDDHFKAIVKCYLTGFFLGNKKSNKYIFDGQAAVKFSEIKPVLNDIYTRSQLWFLDNYREDDLRWKDLISLIKFVSFKGDEVERQLQKNWTTKLKFSGDYNPQNIVTREQFAVVTDLYSTAFAKAIKIDGNFLK